MCVDVPYKEVFTSVRATRTLQKLWIVITGRQLLTSSSGNGGQHGARNWPAVHSVPENTQGPGLISRSWRRRPRPVPSGPKARGLPAHTPGARSKSSRGRRGCYSRLDLGPCCYPRPPSPPRGLHGPGLSCGLLLWGAGSELYPQSPFQRPRCDYGRAGPPPSPLPRLERLCWEPTTAA